jgi:hypothetical protein
MYNSRMNIPRAALDILLEDASSRDRTTARREALLEILHQERYLTREHLIVRVEGKLGKRCFGDSAWKDIFFRDMQVVKRALRAAGHQLVYSRALQRAGYYLRHQPPIGSDLSTILGGCVAEVNPSQIAIYKQLTFQQRFQQGCSISNLVRKVVAYRLRQRNPQLSVAEAHRLALQKNRVFGIHHERIPITANEQAGNTEP